MDFSLNEAEEAVAELAGRILEDVTGNEHPSRSHVEDAPRFDADLWQRLADAELLGLGLSAEAGGSGQSLLAQCLILEQIGRTVAPVPYRESMVVAGAALDRFGTESQKRTWLPALIAGDAVFTAALCEPLNRDVLAPATRATRTADGWRLDGSKTTVPSATIADALLVPAVADGDLRLFLVESSGPGVTVTPQDVATREPFGFVRLIAADVSDESLLGGEAQAGTDVVTFLWERETVGLCATQLGVTEKALELTAQYTTNRIQFQRPIATFQAVGHRAADAYIDVEGIRLTVWQAISLIDQGVEASLAVETAKWWAAEGGHRVAHAAVHLHGGMGVATEYPLHRYFAYAKQLEFMLGGATEQALRIGNDLAASRN